MSNFAARIAAVAAAKPDTVAIEQLHADGSVDSTTYGALDAWSRGVATWLQSKGIVRGDRVAILADNGASWIAAYLGILRIGAVAVPLDTAYKAAQVATVLENSGARLLFTTARYLETAKAAVAKAPGNPVAIVLLIGTAPGITDAGAFSSARPSG